MIMKKDSNNHKINNYYYIIILFSIICLSKPAFSQNSESDSSFHPYHFNYWVTGSIIGVGAAANFLGIPESQNKISITPLELQSLNKSVINGFDSWALKQDPNNTAVYFNYSTGTLVTTIALPFLLLFDKQIRHDWFDMLLMYAETMSITDNLYEWSFLGPAFQNKFRPITYYNQLSYSQRSSGIYRNSFYSGHVAVAAAATFFMAQVYCDYNPGLGDNKYLIYGAALIPPLILGYFRVKTLMHFPSDVMSGLAIGALCGILIPELNRISTKKVSVGVYSSMEGTGLSLQWRPD